MKAQLKVLSTALVALALAAPAFAQDAKPAKPSEIEAATAKPPIEEQLATSKGSVTIKGKAIAYTAQAGTLTVRDDAGKPIISLFYTSYTADGASNRPVTFLYNGGPGSPTIWLHMGSFGPVRVKTDKPESVAPQDFKAGPNPNSLLDVTDVVFIDAPGAGWSRVLEGKPAREVYGVDGDADAFTRGIMRWVAKFNRWNSPKFLLGESYGTLRSGAVAALLEQRGLSLHGVGLLSTILNYGVRQPGYDADYLGLVPGFAATAWYHGKVANKPDLAAYLNEVRAWVDGPYAAALLKGNTISEAEADAVARQLSAYIGLPVPFIRRANLRVELARFQTELLRAEGKSIGRLDTRYKLDPADLNADQPDDDPASTAITGAYVQAFQDYAVRTLGVKTDLAYNLSARGPGFDWDWRHRPPQGRSQTSPNTAVDLAWTMRTNPALKVLFLNGYYDMATPFHSSEFDAAHMVLPAYLLKNIRFTYYESGHMIYLAEGPLAKLHDDVAGWIAETVKR